MRVIKCNGMQIANYRRDASRKGVNRMVNTVAAVQRRTNSMNLLVLAKEQHIRTSCSNAGAYSGMNVTAVGTPQEATIIIDTSYVDVLIADLNLCDSGGWNLITRIKDAQPEMAII